MKIEILDFGLLRGIFQEGVYMGSIYFHSRHQFITSRKSNIFFPYIYRILFYPGYLSIESHLTMLVLQVQTNNTQSTFIFSHNLMIAS